MKLKHPSAVYSEFGNFLARALEVAREKIEEYNLFMNMLVKNGFGAKAFNKLLDIEIKILEEIGWKAFLAIATLAAAGAVAYYGGIGALIASNPILAAVVFTITGSAIYIIYKNRKFVISSKNVGVRYKKDFDILLNTFPKLENRVKPIDELLDKCVQSLIIEAFRISAEEFAKKTNEEKKLLIQNAMRKEINFDVPSSLHLSGEKVASKQIFLCHSKYDKPTVKRLYQALKNVGLRPWMDEFDIISGQDWDLMIKKAIEESEYFLVCLSSDSMDEKGFIHKEIKIGLDLLDEMPENKIFLIPVRLEDCDVPTRMKSRHWVNLYEEGGMEKLIKALTS